MPKFALEKMNKNEGLQILRFFGSGRSVPMLSRCPLCGRRVLLPNKEKEVIRNRNRLTRVVANCRLRHKSLVLAESVEIRATDGAQPVANLRCGP